MFTACSLRSFYATTNNSIVYAQQKIKARAHAALQGGPFVYLLLPTGTCPPTGAGGVTSALLSTGI